VRGLFEGRRECWCSGSGRLGGGQIGGR
jgi:hypothetical protein